MNPVKRDPKVGMVLNSESDAVLDSESSAVLDSPEFELLDLFLPLKMERDQMKHSQVEGE